MKRTIYLVLLIVLTSCNPGKSQNSDHKMIEQSALTNTKIKDHAFLDCMYQDTYFPKFLVDKCKNILLEVCQKIETNKPGNLEELYKLTHEATDQLNELQDEFLENDSEMETGARECLAMEFGFVAQAYDFEADVEELIATREW